MGIFPWIEGGGGRVANWRMLRQAIEVEGELRRRCFPFLKQHLFLLAHDNKRRRLMAVPAGSPQDASVLVEDVSLAKIDTSRTTKSQ